MKIGVNSSADFFAHSDSSAGETGFSFPRKEKPNPVTRPRLFTGACVHKPLETGRGIYPAGLCEGAGG
ncbi:MAG TPA: hypothetical protein VFA77_03095, partial [Candidatus Eisenbacteria bacterium]|nr:hypothetical protein [Candidatus Eisenbacteria bacterium]